jgi:formate-dependent nitrite reductase cytochrome c552 subunit
MVHTEYAADEQNTPATTVLLMKIGGQTWRGTVGIHGAHLDANAKIEYVATDKSRQTIPRVIYTDAAGKTTIYNDTSNPANAQQLAAGQHRMMDCMDCHNRPTHIFQLPERAIDEDMAEGRISPSLPFAKKEALEVLKREYPDRDTAAREISGAITQFYRDKYPEIYRTNKGGIEAAITAVQAIYARNIFPDMKITWGTYPSNLGHMDSPGCFRCHDGNHTAADGKTTIPNDCATCHDTPAMQERNPKILSDLGLKAPAGQTDPPKP